MVRIDTYLTDPRFAGLRPPTGLAETARFWEDLAAVASTEAWWASARHVAEEQRPATP